MSRLFVIVTSDGRVRPERITVHEKADIEVRWGSIRRSKELLAINIEYHRGQEKPTIWIETDEDVNVKWNTKETTAQNRRGTGMGYHR